MLPNLIIPGAQKSATTTLYWWLAQHPQCCMTWPKEPMIFNSPNPAEEHHYADLFPSSDHTASAIRYRGDASTTYLSMPGAAARIKSTLGPDVRIICILRNPAERTCSAYWHMVKRFDERRALRQVCGLESSNLSAAIAREERELVTADQRSLIRSARYARTIGNRHWSFRYLRNSHYLPDLQRFVKLFGRKQVLVITTDDLSAEPQTTYSTVLRFLSLPDAALPINLQRPLNVTRVPQQTKFVRNTAAVLNAVPLVGGKLRHRFLQARSAAPPVTPPDVQDHLVELFKPSCQELANFLKRPVFGAAPECSPRRGAEQAGADLNAA